jgi:hypothetical protein
MKTTHLGLALIAGLAGAPAAALAANARVEAPIRAFIDAFNKGDMKTAAATHLASVSIIDEPPPHYWTGAGAFNGWAGDLAKDAKANGDTDGKVILGSTTDESVSGDHAYTVMNAIYAYTEKGVAMREHGRFTFALTGGRGGWKIAAWAWSGSKPMAAPAAAAKPASAAKSAAPAKPAPGM